MKNIFLLPLFILSLNLLGQNDLTFEANFIQDSTKHSIDANKIILNPKPFTVELILPAYMLEFNGENYSTINFIATMDKNFFETMKKAQCFKCGHDMTPFAFDKHNSLQGMVIGEKGFSFWTIPEEGDDHNVTSYKIDDKNLVARVDVTKLFFADSKKTILMQNFKGTIYLVFEAVNRDSTIIGKRECVKIKVK